MLLHYSMLCSVTAILPVTYDYVRYLVCVTCLGEWAQCHGAFLNPSMSFFLLGYGVLEFRQVGVHSLKCLWETVSHHSVSKLRPGDVLIYSIMSSLSTGYKGWVRKIQDFI